jgi:alkylation response protein AidB-like acyl-CoA dehydrogenase
MNLEQQVRNMLAAGQLDMPFPGRGNTPVRHEALAEIGRRDLSVARLAEPHVDAATILTEAGRHAKSGDLYGVWASETPDQPVVLEQNGAGLVLNGRKHFCSGAGIVDRALVTVSGNEPFLIEVDLRANQGAAIFDESSWITTAFAGTRTAVTTFVDFPVAETDIIGAASWYLDRPGFWHGACGPAACWAGGALGLVDHAMQHARADPHTLAHLGAMAAEAWGLSSYLETAGREIDAEPCNAVTAQMRALKVRHLVDQACTEIIQRFTRAYGPRPLAFDREISRRIQELELYIRQSHAERDLESLGRLVKAVR